METQEEVNAAFLSYYKGLLGIARSHMKSIVAGVVEAGAILNEAQKEGMMRQITSTEVKNAIFSIHEESHLDQMVLELSFTRMTGR